jgi:hypothetical protein
MVALCSIPREWRRIDAQTAGPIVAECDDRKVA